MNPESNKRRFRIYIPLALVILMVLAVAIYWYRDYSSYITTDDAHVDADNVSIGSKILGRISAIYFSEGDEVKAGKLLAVLDSSDLVAQRNQAMALRSQALANLVQAEIRYNSDQKGIKVLEISRERASDDFERAKVQSEGGVITAEQFSHIEKAYETAAAQLDAARTQLMVSRSMISSASAAAEVTNAQVKVLDTQLKNTRLYAPVNGVLSKRWLLPGDIVQPSQSVFTITINENLWVTAFLEETKISEIHPGQKVRFSIDAFPGVRFEGNVFLVGSTTASVFSLIPANNASGNFTKVTQRIPVKISIDGTDNGEDISSFNIKSGMSAEVKISRKE
jgi:membrane fusion protein (multidrug efflux system)